MSNCCVVPVRDTAAVSDGDAICSVWTIGAVGGVSGDYGIWRVGVWSE